MKNVSKKQAKELAALAALPDGKIDLTDVPEVLDWSHGVVGKFYRPIKKPLTIRLDADVLAWLKTRGAVTRRASINSSERPWKAEDAVAEPKWMAPDVEEIAFLHRVQQVC